MQRLNALSVVLIVALSLALASCGGDDDDAGSASSEPTTVAAVSSATPVATALSASTATPAIAPAAGTQASTPAMPAGSTPMQGTAVDAMLAAQVDQMAGALAAHDRNWWHGHVDLDAHHDDHVASHDHAHLQQQDVTRLMTCVLDGTRVEPVSRTMTIDGDMATVVVTFSVTAADGTVSTVTRTWVFERDDDGTWLLIDVPDCPRT